MINENVCVTGKRLRLVPYLPHHVPQYHQWMCDRELLHYTASDPLTLEEEYENQREWMRSEDKLTFILLAPLSSVVSENLIDAHEGVIASSSVKPHKNSMKLHNIANSCGGSAEDGGDAQEGTLFPSVIGTPLPDQCPEGDGLDRQIGTEMRRSYVMIGDCNLFLISNDAYSNEYDDEEVKNNDGKKTFEVEVMIADRAFRQKGFGEEAVRLLISYALDRLDAWRFVAKILEDNESSIKLFMGKLGFSLLKEVRVFNEKHYIRRIESLEELTEWKRIPEYKIGIYDETVEEQMTVLHSLPEMLRNESVETATPVSVNI